MDWKNLKKAAIGAVTAGLAYVGINLANDDADKPPVSATEVCVVDKTGTRAQIMDSKTLESKATMPKADLGRVGWDVTGKLYTPKEGGLGWKDDGYGLKVGIKLCEKFERGTNQETITTYKRAQGVDLDEVIDAKIGRSPHEKPEYSAVNEALNGRKTEAVIAPSTIEEPLPRPGAAPAAGGPKL